MDSAKGNVALFKAKVAVLKKVQRKTSESICQAIINGLESLTDKVLTIISDNGSEFAKHKTIAEKLEADFYFAHPYSSWERGLNENTNGLVRQYFKKGSDFTHISVDMLESIMEKLNSRPRKTLGFLTPKKVINL